MSKIAFPELPYESWKETKTTLHLFTQIVGKVRMSLVPKLNHWWHVTFYVTPRGLTTSYMPCKGGGIEMLFDFRRHYLFIRPGSGETSGIPLRGTSVAEMCAQVLATMSKLGIKVHIKDDVFDPAKVGSEIPYSQDTEHDTYDPEPVEQYFKALRGINSVLLRFRGRYLGKCSPVHQFWHSFDLAVTRFSGRVTQVSPQADQVTKEAYSHEVSSVGFWPGDNTFPEAAFYSYTHPEPAGLETQPLEPDRAWWQKINGTHMALYKYEDFRKASRPRKSLLAFCQSSYKAGAILGKWPREELERAKSV